MPTVLLAMLSVLWLANDGPLNPSTTQPLLTSVVLLQAAELDVQRILNDLHSEDVERVIAALKSLETLEGDVSPLVTWLSVIIEADDYENIDLAFRALQRLKAKASPAIPILCRKLDDRRYWIRSSAIEALIAIGETAVPSAEKLLTAKSAAVRAGATEVLGRLNRLTLEQIPLLAKDADPRVRAALARPLSQLGAPAIPHLVELVRDPEDAVSLQGIRALELNHHDATPAIRCLTEALSRLQLRHAAGKALASYGMAAQRAIPGIIDSYPRDKASENWFGDSAEEALQHIGPPHVDDIPALCLCLKNPHKNAVQLAAQKLGMLGAQAESAVPALTETWKAAIDEYVRLKQAAGPNAKRAFQSNDGWRLLSVAVRVTEAIWKITGDDLRFLETLEMIAIKSEQFVEYSRLYNCPDWQALSDKAVPHLERMLRHTDRNVRLTALRGMDEAGPVTSPLKQLVVELSNSDDEEQARFAKKALFKMGPGGVGAIGTRLLTDFRNEKMSLYELAYWMYHENLRTPELLQALESGLRDQREIGADRPSAAVLGMLTNEPRQLATRLIKAVDEDQVQFDIASSALLELETVDDLLAPFFLRQAKALLYRTNIQDISDHIILDGLAKVGAAAKSQLPRIEELAKDRNNDLWNRLIAARAILMIAKNPVPLNQALKEAFENQHSPLRERQFQDPFASFDEDLRTDTLVGISTIADCKQSGTPFIHFIVDEIINHPHEMSAYGIPELRRMDSPAAIAALEQLAQSPDWVLRTEARDALKKPPQRLFFIYSP